MGYSDSPNLYQAFLNSPANYIDPFGRTSLREVIHGYTEEAFVDGNYLSKGIAILGQFGYATVEFASVGSVSKIDMAQEQLDQNQITKQQYWKQTSIAVAQTTASYIVAPLAGSGGAKLGVKVLGSFGVTKNIVQASGLLAGASASTGSKLAIDLIGVASGTQERVSSAQSYLASAIVGGTLGVLKSLPARTQRDAGVDPQAPAALPLRRPISRSPSQNARAQTDIATAISRGTQNVRVNQQQVDVSGQRVGVCRPDVQYTLNGRRIYVEYDTPSSDRVVNHALRLISNDAQCKVYTITQP